MPAIHDSGPVSDPTATADRRLVGVDLARSLAVFGMLTVHLVPGQRDGHATWSATVAGGRASALFAVLAGVGLSLASRRSRGPDPTLPRRAVAASVLVRAVVIGLLGLVLVSFESGLAVILPAYALLFVLAIPMTWLSTRWLVVLAAALALGAPVLSHLLRAHLLRVHLPPGPGEQPTLASLAHPVRLFETVAVTGYYPALTWSTYLAAGLVVGRLTLRGTPTALGLVGVGAVLAILGWAVSGLLLSGGGLESLERSVAAAGGDPDGLGLRLTQTQFGTTPTDTWCWLAVRAQHSGTPFDLVHTTGTALAVIGGCLLLAGATQRAGRPAGSGPTAARAVLYAASSPGSMPLTVYTAQLVGLALHLRAATAADEAVHDLVLVTYVALAVVGATWWRHRYGRGPLEELIALPAGSVRDAVTAGTRRDGLLAGPRG